MPNPFANEFIQSVVRESNGTVVAVSESEMITGVDVVARLEGLILSPEGSASFMGLKS